jgi:phage shock protein PspC (stress-responsive transcriptional regulator)
MIFGVAGGMARWLDVDPSTVRIVWLLLIFTGVGVLLYIGAAIIVPEEPLGVAGPGGAPGTAGTEGAAAGWGASGPAATTRSRSGSGPVVIGIVLVLIGVWFLAQRYIPWLDGALLWPALLIVIGAMLVFGAMRRQGGPPA